MQKGTFIHKLLQFLPDIEEKQRVDFIQKLTPLGMEPPLDILDLFDNPEMKILFGSNSIPEIPIIGVNTEGKVISGQIDRLVVSQNEVLIIDFKTNRYPPKNIKDVPLAYTEQMNAYKGLLKNIFSDKKIRCFLLWTTTLTLMELK